MHPILFKIGPIVIHSYGVMLAIAFIVGVYIAKYIAKEKGLKEDLIVDFCMYVVIISIVCARIYYMLFYDLETFLDSWYRIFFIWEGGLSIHGGLIGGVCTALWFCKKKKINFWMFVDIIAPSVAIGQAIGRIGCFLSGCCYGAPTDMSWGVIYHNFNALAPIGARLHPAQIYEMFADMSIFVVLWLYRKKIKIDGYLFLLYIILYSIARFIVEIFRGDSIYISDTPIKTTYVVSILSIISCLALMRILYCSHKTRNN